MGYKIYARHPLLPVRENLKANVQAFNNSPGRKAQSPRGRELAPHPHPLERWFEQIWNNQNNIYSHVCGLYNRPYFRSPQVVS